MTVWQIIFMIGYLILAPLFGGLMEGVDRKLSARMQRRIGPPILQPFYDVKKLLSKQTIVVGRAQSFFILSYLILMVVTGMMFYAGSDILMCFFVMSTASTFLYFAAVVTSSPMSTIGANRELLQMMAYEPAVLLTCVGFYLVSHTFNVSGILQSQVSPILYIPGFFVAFVFILNIKLRKSPFDESTSHHAHQELVKGITTELGARNLALYTIAEWYEISFVFGVVALFILNRNPISILFAILVVLAVYFLEVLIDNTSARMKWEKMLKMTWIVTLVTAGINLLILMLVM